VEGRHWEIKNSSPPAMTISYFSFIEVGVDIDSLHQSHETKYILHVRRAPCEVVRRTRTYVRDIYGQWINFRKSISLRCLRAQRRRTQEDANSSRETQGIRRRGERSDHVRPQLSNIKSWRGGSLQLRVHHGFLETVGKNPEKAASQLPGTSG
jgi:hypothetical protein